MSLSYPFAKPPDFGATLEVARGVHWMRQPLAMALNHINVYMLDDPAGSWIIDTGHQTEESQNHWRRQMSDGALAANPPQAVLCTHMHSDHIGLAGWLCREYDLPLHMSIGEYMSVRLFQGAASDSHDGALNFYREAGIDPKTMEVLESRIDSRNPDVAILPSVYHRLKLGQRLEIGGRIWQVMIGHGHSPEHVCLFNADERLLLGGDQVLPKITSNISVMPSSPEANPLQDWFDSLERFAELPADTLVLPSHNRPFRGLHERLADIRAHHEERLADLHAHLRTRDFAADEGASPVELLPTLFKRPLKGIESVMAVGECIAHLHLLVARHQAQRIDTAGGSRYRALPGPSAALDSSRVLR